MSGRRRNKVHLPENIPAKANRVLNIVLIGMTLITLRVWHLAVVQHEERLEESRRPQKRVVSEPAKRGTIRDRFNIPLAINKVQYNAAVMYSQIRQIPSVKWELVDGKKVKVYKRKEYISELSSILGEELNLDPERLEDLIHSKASLYNNLPFVVKEDLSEKEYYRLKMLEKDWLGIHTECLPKRCYPLGKVGADIIGYMGAISREEYEAVIEEIKTLEHYLQGDEGGEDFTLPPGIVKREQAEQRLQALIEHAYSVTDYVGKAGIEGRFEEHLRGYHGKKSYYSDARGNFLREFPGSRPPLSGQRLLLSISAELQEYCEKLLVQNEKVRVPRITGVNNSDSRKLAKKHPWIKGGAVVAMDPISGDVLAMASYPRYDPNDFIASGNPDIGPKKIAAIHRWFETEEYLAEVWDQKRPLEREIFDLKEEKITEEAVWLTWEKYLNFVLSENSPVKEGLKKVKSVNDAMDLQRQVESLMDMAGNPSLYALFNLIYKEAPNIPHGSRLPAVQQERLEESVVENDRAVSEAKKALGRYFEKIPHNYDKVLLVDLCRLIVDPDRISEEARAALGKETLSEYRQNNAAWVVLEQAAKNLTKDLFREADFKNWKEKNIKQFLKEKREEEKKAGVKYPKPYLDLLDKKEAEMFAAFWHEMRWNILFTLLTGNKASEDPSLQIYYDHFSTWHQELTQGAHKALDWGKAYRTLEKTVGSLSQRQAIAMMRSFRDYYNLGRPLYGRYRGVRKENNQQLEKHLAAAFYPAYGFGYGRSHAFRQAATQGSIFKIVTAYEALVQKFRKVESSKTTSSLNPFVMVDDTHKRGKATYVGYDSKGKPIPQAYKGGRLPRSHRSGIGKVDLLTAFEVSSNPYFSLLAVDYLENPLDLAESAKKFCFGSKTGIDLPAEIAGSVPCDLDCNRNGLYAMAIGQHSLVVTPLQAAVMISSIANKGKRLKPKIVNMVIGKEGKDTASTKVQLSPTEVLGNIFLPDVVREILLEGMLRVSKRTLNSAWGSLTELYQDYPEAISDMLEMDGQLLGKSSTAESVETIDLDLESGTSIYNHTWFGGIVYDPKGNHSGTHVFRDRYGNPELVVIVYLRYGAWGKDTVPVAAQVAQKWREIKSRHKADTL